eukprot:2246325-Pyramimonas_sp.AAC.1
MNLQSWAARTGYPEQQRAGKVLENLPIDVQQRFVSIRPTLDHEKGPTTLIERLSVLNGERPGDKEREAHCAALFHYGIRRGETLTDFVLRRDLETAEVERFGLALPDQVKARFFEEGAQLTPQDRINLKTLAAGKSDSTSIRQALLLLDVRDKSMLPTSASQNVTKTYQAEIQQDMEHPPPPPL